MSDFKKLQKEWYQKLKESGFIDIENENGNLKEEPRSRTLQIKTREQQEAYYSIAQDHLNSYKFELSYEKDIWQLHCEGKSFRKIEATLNIYKDKVDKTIQKHKALAGLNKWKQK